MSDDSLFLITILVSGFGWVIYRLFKIEAAIRENTRAVRNYRKRTAGLEKAGEEEQKPKARRASKTAKREAAS